MQSIKAFIAGFVSTLVFHQGMLALLHKLNPAAPAPFNVTATAPWNVPAVISLAFWGGVWGIVLWALISGFRGGRYWGTAAIIGALGPSLVAWFVVMPMKGMAAAGGGDPKIIFGALILNAAWGLGVALIMSVIGRTQGGVT